MKKLIICEKPSLAMNVVNAIGQMQKNDGYFENDNYVVTFAFGHLLSLYDIDDYFNREKTKWNLSELPFIPEKFLFKIKDDSGAKKQFKIIKELIKRTDITEVVNCGDADREGEVIINNIIYYVFNELNISKPITRLWLPEQTSETIKNALQRLKSIKETNNLMNEGLARTYTDWIYGINLTRYLTLKLKSLFPVGRVLVPIVKYVYDRDMAIKNFEPKHYLDIDTIITKDNNEIKLIFKDFKFSDDSEESEREAKSLVERLQNEKIIVEDVKTTDKVKQRPKLFSLDTLQNYMFKKYKVSLADTLKTLQSLYEHGYVTYPRTNTEYLSNNQKDDIKKLITSFDDPNIEFLDKKTIFDDSKIESHSALTPTLRHPGTLTDAEDMLYNVIKNRFCAVFCKEDTVIKEVESIFKFSNTEYRSKLKSSSIKSLGFLRYEPIEEKILPPFEIGEEFNQKLEITSKVTTPPSKATDADLNRFLKNPYKSSEMPGEESILEENSNEANDELLYKELMEGVEIGTVATRSGTIENAIKYEYLKKQKNSLSITDKGISLIENLIKLKIDMSVDKTVDVSRKLKKIYKNDYTINELIEDISNELYKYFDNDIQIDSFSQEREVIGICPKCGKKVLENDKSFYCEDYKNCNFSVWKKNKFFESVGLKRFTKANMKNCLEKGYFEAKHLQSKSGKEYNAKLIMELSDKYVSWKISFDK